MKLEEHHAYTLSFELSNYIWNIVINWDYYVKILFVNKFLY